MTDKVGTVPCLVCGEPFLYLTTAHMSTHPRGNPQTDPEYKTDMAEKWGISEDEIPLSPAEWRQQKHRFDGWRDDVI